MTFQITPLAAKVNNLNGSSNASSVSGAKVLYIMGTAEDTITNKNTGASFQIAANQPIVMFKQTTEQVFSGVTTTHFTKIEFPRG